MVRSASILGTRQTATVEVNNGVVKGMRKNSKIVGFSWALLASLLNSLIGPLNEKSFALGSNFYATALYKTVGALFILTVLLALLPKARRDAVALVPQLPKVVLMAFLGVFTLYFFETWAFSASNIPMTSFMIYVPGVVSIVLGYLFLKEQLGWVNILCFALILGGSYLLLVGEKSPALRVGALYALIGGLGYALFIFFSACFSIKATIGLLWWLFLWGACFLTVPALLTNSWQIPLPSMVPVLLLSVFPTIGGFFCTLKAAAYIGAGEMQMVETCDPLFASILAAVFFSQSLGLFSSCGAALIMLAILLLGFHQSRSSSA
ncbi:hypothetical protein LMG33810_002054 [Carnimonas sp. LMG 33810]